MNDDRADTSSKHTVDRKGTTFLVPLSIGIVFVVLAILWVSMATNQDRSSGKEVMTRPDAPTRNSAGR